MLGMCTYLRRLSTPGPICRGPVGPVSNHAEAHLLGRARYPPALEPHIHPRRLPVVGLIQDVHEAIAVEIGYARLVEPHAPDELGLPEVSLAVAEEDPGPGARVIGLWVLLVPLRHFGSEDVEMSVSI